MQLKLFITYPLNTWLMRPCLGRLMWMGVIYSHVKAKVMVKGGYYCGPALTADLHPARLTF